MNIIEETVKNIKSLKIQGATSVARACLLALQKLKIKNEKLKIEELEKVVEKLAHARPTEPLTRNCLSYILWQVKKGGKLIENIDLMLARLTDVENEIVKNGVGLIKPGMRILTHCHSSMVENVLKAAHQKGIEFFVYVTETRPRFQGRITAKNLTEAGIKTTMITDSAASSTLSRLDEIEIDLVLLGCDAISTDGSCVNKVGSYAIGLAAKEAKIPLCIISTLLKFAPETKTGKLVNIEERRPSEIWKAPPKELRIIGPAFDFVPADKITSYITEFGVIKPKKIKTKIRRNYPWIIKKLKIKNEKLKMKKKFSYLHLGGKLDPQKHIIATFRIESNYPLNKAAEQVAAESSIGSWTKITYQTKERFNQLSAKIFKIDQKTKTVEIAYPLALFEPGNIPQLLSSVAGNIFGMKSIENLRLKDLKLPEKYVRVFPGPSIGLKGIRKYLDIKKGPILCSIIKPKEGLDVDEHVGIARELFEAGIDLVKDDENLTSPDFNPFDQRLVLIMKEIRRIKTPHLYAFNITAGYDLMIRRAQRAKNAGSQCVMIDIMTVGFSALQSLRKKFPNLIIHGHRAMHGAMTRNIKHGVAMIVLAKLARLSGVDQLHTGTIIGKMEGEKEEVLEINSFLRSEWYGLKPVLPIASGGLYPALIPNLVEILGKEMIFAFGGGIHGHPQGAYAGARAVFEAREAVEKKISLREYAKTHKNLKAALKMWPEEMEW